MTKTFHAGHKEWSGTLKLLENGDFVGGCARPDGKWEFVAGESNLLL